MSGPLPHTEGDRADHGPQTGPDAPTAETAVLPTSDGDPTVAPRPSRGAQSREREAAEPSVPAEAAPPADGATGRPSFRRRAALRRRARGLETRRDALLRDLGGLVAELRRADRERPDLVEERAEAAARLSAELEAIRAELGDGRTAGPPVPPALGGECPRCAAVHGAEDAYCSVCGTDLRGAR